ncbi:hypothetical protein [Cyclobacterium plantarum]|uniref:hypothetical protein n=1 Tax=Cyclobacterium plantarum TaxID=2716263 RepID=UPI003F703A7F
MPKRSAISPSRRQELEVRNALYVITCYQNEFYCENHPQGICPRGFFSLFLQALYGIGFAKRHKVPYYVDFGNVRYAYSSYPTDSGAENFWNELVNQEKPKGDFHAVYNQQYETFPLKIWARSHLRELNQIFREEITLIDSLKTKIKKVKKSFGTFKVLGVHWRKTDHYMEVSPVPEKVFMHTLERKLKGFDKLFVATDDQNLLGNLKDKFPGKILAHDVSRSIDGEPIHDIKAGNDGSCLAKEALLDCLSLSFCDELVLSPSNFSYSALVFNPEVKYTIMETEMARWTRIKTLLVFFLNRWGIRKW